METNTEQQQYTLIINARTKPLLRACYILSIDSYINDKFTLTSPPKLRYLGTVDYHIWTVDTSLGIYVPLKAIKKVKE